MGLGEGRHLHGIVRDERGLHQVVLALLAENLVNQLALAHAVVHLDAEGSAGSAQSGLVHAVDVHVGVLEDGIAHRQPAIGRREVDRVAFERGGVGAVNRLADPLKQLLDGLHHPMVVLVGDVELEDGELRIVRPVHALVAEVAGKFEDTVKAAHNQTLQVELVGDAQVEGDVQRVVVGDERTGRGATGNGLQHRGVHLEPPLLGEGVAHGLDDPAAGLESALDLGVDHQVDVAHPVAELRVGERIVHLPVLVGLHGGQRANGLAQHGELLDEHARLAGLRGEGGALHPDDVTAVEQLLEDGVVHRLVLPRAELVAVEVNLNLARSVLQLGERRLAHDAAGQNAARQAHFAVRGEVGAQRSGMRVHRIGGRWIGVDAQGAKLGEALKSDAFLFGSDHGETVDGRLGEIRPLPAVLPAVLSGSPRHFPCATSSPPFPSSFPAPRPPWPHKACRLTFPPTTASSYWAWAALASGADSCPGCSPTPLPCPSQAATITAFQRGSDPPRS